MFPYGKRSLGEKVKQGRRIGDKAGLPATVLQGVAILHRLVKNKDSLTAKMASELRPRSPRKSQRKENSSHRGKYKGPW